ncbi:MAG: PASTA domain-containing protein [Rhodanobacter sp.]
MNIVMGEGIIQRMAHGRFALMLATIHDRMTRTIRSCRRWGLLIVFAMCFVSPIAAWQGPPQPAKPHEDIKSVQESQQQAESPPHIPPAVVAGPLSKTMPYLIGMPYTNALGILSKMQFPHPRLQYAPSNQPEGVVVGQQPAAYANVKGVEMVTLQVSRGPLPPSEMMPYLIGMPYTNALGILSKMQLPHPRLQYAPSNQPEGVVVGQQPAAYANVKGVETVTLQVSRGPLPPSETMPPLIGMPYTNALGILSKMQLPHPSLQYMTSNQPNGVVIGQSPSPGTDMHGIAAVSLQVSRISDIRVPDVVGSSESDATASFTQLQLHAVPQGDESSRRQQGQVTRTEPVSGTLVQPGATVMYWLASGNNVVPDLLRRTVDDAQVILKRAGFRPGGVSYKTTPGPAGLVIGQVPKAGSIASMNSSMAITVGTLIPPPPMPHVEGMTPDQASSTLNKAGFATVTVVHKFHLAMPNRVFRQDPQPSAAIDPNTNVSLEVPSLTGLAVFAAGLLAGAGGIGAGLLRAYQGHLINITRRLLHIKPSLGAGSETRITQGLPPQMDEPAIALRPRLEEGEVIFDGPVSIERKEISHD